MNIVLGVIACVLIFILLFLVLARRFGNRKYKEAKMFEGQGKYKDACLEYAIAILNGTYFTKDCKERIKYLWDKYGPFDYADILEEIKKDDTPEGCGAAGHAAAMSIIKEIVSPIPK